MKPRTRKHVYTALRVALCVGLLWFVARGVTLRDRVVLADGKTELVGTVAVENDVIVVATDDGASRTLGPRDVASAEDGQPRISYGLASTWRQSHKRLLLLAILIHLPVVLPQALRFCWLLRAQQIDISYWEGLKLSLAGNFLNFAAPFGSNAGDVFKAYFASLHTADRKTEAVATVVLDRLIGLISLLLVVAIITALSPGGSRLAQLRPYILTMFGLALAGGTLYLLPWWRGWGPITQLRAKLPFLDQVRRVDRAARVLASQVGVVVAAVVLTILLQALAMLAYFMVALAVGMDAGVDNLFEYFAYFYTGTVVQALPGPPQGLGTVELAYRYFFASFGSPTQIICMALAIRLVALICALPGLVIALTGAYRPRALAEIGGDQGDDVFHPDEPKAASLIARSQPAKA